MIKQSNDGTKVIFECHFVADPKPTIEWYYKNKVVKEGSKHKYILESDKINHIGLLEISKVVAEDAGEYKLVAKNKHGDGFATVTLNFDAGKPQIPEGKAPKFPKKPTIKQVGGGLVLECVLEAKPFPEITWYHETKQIVDGIRHKSSRKDLGNDTYSLSLEIQDPALEDGGTYRCNAINDLGESNANIALNFQGGDEEEDDLSPQFVTKPKIIPKNGGALIVMECRIRSTTKVTTMWYKETTIIKETTRIKSTIVSEGSEEYTVRLEIQVQV